MRRRLLRALAAAMLLLTGPGWGVSAPAPAAASGGVLPDLAMAPLTDFRIQWVNGRRVLRFTAAFVNVGSGHFEVRGSRSSTSQPMRYTQIVYQSTARNSAVAQQIPTNAVALYSGDGHNHWHVQEMTRYDLWGAAGTFRGAKIGLCFLDSDPYDLSLPGEVGPYYTSSMCSTNRNALSNRMGVSVGWSDLYGWYLAWQWVDITDLPSGTYYVRAKVDPYGVFTEEDEANQCAWARVSFTSSSNAVSVAARGSTCISDYDGSIFAGDIAWAFAEGITVGCAPDLFCPNTSVTRQQMASFLARALGLPGPMGDHFTDDEASAHEGDINRIFEAGITAGCGGTRFCPTRTVTREQMASFLVRALDLPATSVDYFTDDGASAHEADINSLAEAGITGGCTATTYCPRAFVTRAQMAAFLHRAFGS